MYETGFLSRHETRWICSSSITIWFLKRVKTKKKMTQLKNYQFLQNSQNFLRKMFSFQENTEKLSFGTRCNLKNFKIPCFSCYDKSLICFLEPESKNEGWNNVCSISSGADLLHLTRLSPIVFCWLCH